MILLVTATALAALAQPSSPTSGAAAAPASCRPSPQLAAYPNGGSAVRRLGELPSAELTRAVYRQANGCALLEVKTRGEGWTLRPAGRAGVGASPLSPGAR